MLGSKNVLDMPKSEKNDTEKHTENHIEKNIKTETCECMEREARFHCRP